MTAVPTVDHVAKFISATISALLSLQGWRGTVCFTIHIDSDTQSVRVIPQVLPLM